MDLKDLKKLLDCSEEYITTSIKFKLNGKCTNANLVTVMQNKNVKEQFVLYKGKRTKLSTIGIFEDGYCTCCEEVIVTPGGSSNPNSSEIGGVGSGGAGIGGGLVEAWANAKLFNTAIENQFFCGGGFSNVKVVDFANNLYMQFNYSNINTASCLVTLLASDNTVLQVSPNNILDGVGSVTLPLGSVTNQSAVQKILITAATYGTSNTPLCTNGSITFQV
jgi:hypothetical protein